eukprot:2079583-Rhodomonas_salina.1
MEGRDVVVAVSAQLASVLRTVVSELPFGEVAEKLFSKVEETLKATASNNELAATACERVVLLWSTLQRIIRSRFQSTEIFAHYTDVLIEMHNKAIEWQNKGRWGKWWKANAYQLEFEGLFAKLKRATEDLTLCVVVEAKVDADSAFEKFGQINQQLKQKSDIIAAQLTEQHSE